MRCTSALCPPLRLVTMESTTGNLVHLEEYVDSKKALELILFYLKYFLLLSVISF